MIDDLLPLLVKAKVFSVVDARNGFCHVQLDNESSFLKRFLGMVKYLQKFAPNLSEVTAPMRDLLKQRNEFHWDKEVQGQTFKQVKEILSAAPVLEFFDPKESVELQCDASDKGLGACLTQGGQLHNRSKKNCLPSSLE